MKHLLCFGFSYTACALVPGLLASGWQVSATSRSAGGLQTIAAAGVTPVPFGSDIDFSTISHCLQSAAPDDRSDPVARTYGEALGRASSHLQGFFYLSTTGVYGDRSGAWVDETSPLAPNTARGERRLAAETFWLNLWRETGLPVQIFRLPGIYGPGRNALDSVRAGTARRIIRQGQVFSRIHVTDIAGVLALALERESPGEAWNVCDDEPCPPQDVIVYAAQLLGLEPPPEEAFEGANLSPMAASFYADSKRVSNTKIKSVLSCALRYPTYREGLRGLLETLPRP